MTQLEYARCDAIIDGAEYNRLRLTREQLIERIIDPMIARLCQLVKDVDPEGVVWVDVRFTPNTKAQFKARMEATDSHG